MAKAKVLNIVGMARMATIKFAQALLDTGVNVTSVIRPTSSDFIHIKGKGRFNLEVLVDYANKNFFVSVMTRKGHKQTQAVCATYNEFKALLTTWNIAAY
jgi:hypothetical protein